MKRLSLLLAIFLSFVLADPAGAWFWDKNEVESPAVSQEVRTDVGHKTGEKGILVRIKEAGRELRAYFRGTGKEVKKSAKKAPGELKKGAKEARRDLREGGRELKQETKELPGQFKEGAKDVGQGFKQLGRDIKKGTKKALGDK